MPSHEQNDDTWEDRVSDHTLEFPSDLVDGARQGDERALRALTERAYPVVRRWALVHTGDPTEADDLTQDVLVQMIRKMESFQGDARFSTWLYTVTRNAASDRHRKQARRTRLAESPTAYLELVPQAANDPAKEAARRELGDMLSVFFEQLPGRQREIFDLVELQGLSGAEVSHLLGIEPVSVRAHLFKARKRLRRLILQTSPELVEGLS